MDFFATITTLIEKLGSEFQFKALQMGRISAVCPCHSGNTQVGPAGAAADSALPTERSAQTRVPELLKMSIIPLQSLC